MRERKDLGQKELLEQLRGFEIYYSDERYIREFEAGQRRPPRLALITMLVRCFELEQITKIDETLACFEYASLSPKEIEKFGLDVKTPLPEPQVVGWGPPDGKPLGIWISSKDGAFIPWHALKQEIEGLLIPKVKHVPLGSTVEIGNLRDRQNWIIRLLDPNGVEIGNVWFGPDPEASWRFDGLVRLGGLHRTSGRVVWQVFQRYSDGSYRRITTYD